MRVATRISVATGTLLVLHLAVLYLHTSYARNLAASNLAISELNPVLKDAVEQTLLPDKAYPHVRSYFQIYGEVSLPSAGGLSRGAKQSARDSRALRGEPPHPRRSRHPEHHSDDGPSDRGG